MENQRAISKKVNIAETYFCNILSGRRRPSWDVAKRLESVTGINAVDWMDGLVDRETLLQSYNNQEVAV